MSGSSRAAAGAGAGAGAEFLPPKITAAEVALAASRLAGPYADHDEVRSHFEVLHSDIREISKAIDKMTPKSLFREYKNMLLNDKFLSAVSLTIIRCISLSQMGLLTPLLKKISELTVEISKPKRSKTKAGRVTADSFTGRLFEDLFKQLSTADCVKVKRKTDRGLIDLMIAYEGFPADWVAKVVKVLGVQYEINAGALTGFTLIELLVKFKRVDVLLNLYDSGLLPDVYFDRRFGYDATIAVGLIRSGVSGNKFGELIDAWPDQAFMNCISDGPTYTPSVAAVLENRSDILYHLCRYEVELKKEGGSSAFEPVYHEALGPETPIHFIAFSKLKLDMVIMIKSAQGERPELHEPRALMKSIMGSQKVEFYLNDLLGKPKILTRMRDEMKRNLAKIEVESKMGAMFLPVMVSINHDVEPLEIRRKLLEWSLSDMPDLPYHLYLAHENEGLKCELELIKKSLELIEDAYSALSKPRSLKSESSAGLEVEGGVSYVSIEPSAQATTELSLELKETREHSEVLQAHIKTLKEENKKAQLELAQSHCNIQELAEKLSAKQAEVEVVKTRLDEVIVGLERQEKLAKSLKKEKTVLESRLSTYTNQAERVASLTAAIQRVVREKSEVSRQLKDACKKLKQSRLAFYRRSAQLNRFYNESHPLNGFRPHLLAIQAELIKMLGKNYKGLVVYGSASDSTRFIKGDLDCIVCVSPEGYELLKREPRFEPKSFGMIDFSFGEGRQSQMYEFVPGEFLKNVRVKIDFKVAEVEKDQALKWSRDMATVSSKKHTPIDVDVFLSSPLAPLEYDFELTLENPKLTEYVADVLKNLFMNRISGCGLVRKEGPHLLENLDFIQKNITQYDVVKGVEQAVRNNPGLHQYGLIGWLVELKLWHMEPRSPLSSRGSPSLAFGVSVTPSSPDSSTSASSSGSDPIGLSLGTGPVAGAGAGAGAR